MYCVYYHNCNVVQKHYCSCINHDHVCCISRLSLKSDVGVQTIFSEKQTINFKGIDPNIIVVVIMVNNRL